MPKIYTLELETNEAEVLRNIMKDAVRDAEAVEEIAKKHNMSYSWSGVAVQNCKMLKELFEKVSAALRQPEGTSL